MGELRSAPLRYVTASWSARLSTSCHGPKWVTAGWFAMATLSSRCDLAAFTCKIPLQDRWVLPLHATGHYFLQATILAGFQLVVFGSKSNLFQWVLPLKKRAQSPLLNTGKLLQRGPNMVCRCGALETYPLVWAYLEQEGKSNVKNFITN